MHKKSVFALNISKRLFGFGYDSLCNYVNEVSEALEKRWQELAAKIEEDLNAITSEESEEYIDVIYDDMAMVRNALPQINGQAQILNIYAFMEHELIRLCEQYMRANNLSVSVTDLKGGGLQSSRVFLEKVAMFELKENEVWDRLNNFNKVRNVIAHYNGYLSSDYYHYKRLKKFISSNPAFIEFKPLSNSAKSSGELIIRKEGVMQFREDVGSYFSEIYSCWSTVAKWS